MAVESRYCIKCGAEIKPIDPEAPYSSPQSAMWNGGIVDKIAAGYGSKLDGNIYIIAICDECVLNSEVIEYIGNYI